MSTELAWPEVAVRLALTVIAGAVVGANRGELGRPAGLRTTILVCLAASVSMIQANLLLGTAGQKETSFVHLDLMRLPLGVLSGMGFIGAGAILRRGDRVLGVTTAATLWFVTVMGLCFGGGQIGLGITLLAIAMCVLWGLKLIEQRLFFDRRRRLSILASFDGPSPEDVLQALSADGMLVASYSMQWISRKEHRKIVCEVRCKAGAEGLMPPASVADLARRSGVLKLEWHN